MKDDEKRLLKYDIIEAAKPLFASKDVERIVYAACGIILIGFLYLVFSWIGWKR